MEPGDGELVVPSVLQPCIEIPGGINTVAVTSAGVSMQGSFQDGIGRQQVGVSVGATTTATAKLGAGLWHISGQLWVFFKGTDNGGNVLTLQLVDPAANANNLWAAFAFGTMAIGYSVEEIYNLMSDGFFFQLVTPATIAGDVLGLSFNYRARKLS